MKDYPAGVRDLLVRGLDRALLEQLCKLYSVAVTQNDADALERCGKGIDKAVAVYLALNDMIGDSEEPLA